MKRRENEKKIVCVKCLIKNLIIEFLKDFILLIKKHFSLLNADIFTSN